MPGVGESAPGIFLRIDFDMYLVLEYNNEAIRIVRLEGSYDRTV